MTEAEAKTKWCPFAIVSDTDEPPVAINRHWRDSAPERGTFCLASACMAWRHADPINEEQSGFCGLAGKPINPFA